MKLIYELNTQQDLGETYSNGIPVFYSSKKAAEFFLQQELSQNQAIMITDDEYLTPEVYPDIILSKRYYSVPVDKTGFIAYRVTLRKHKCYGL